MPVTDPGSGEPRLDRAEHDIQRLFDRQEKQADQFDELRRDLQRDLRDTQARVEQTAARLEQKIAEHQGELVGAISDLEKHLGDQDALLREQFQRDDDLIIGRFTWPSSKLWLYGLAATMLVTLLVHYVLHIG